MYSLTFIQLLVVTSVSLEHLPVLAAQRPQASSTGDGPTATIGSGPIIGRVTQIPDSNTTINQFLGVPFAAPPVGDLRFAPPQEPESWDEPYNATEKSLGCMQYRGPNGTIADATDLLYYTPPVPGPAEDCLYLNVYAPATEDVDDKEGKPVLFFIHGGSGVAGSASQPLYDGTSFAANHDIVVVVANHRLGLFGQPRAPGLPLKESNVGFMDQRLALEWTQRNVGAFGGDPKKVTIMGQSSGAVGVATMVNTYPYDPPFRAAVEMSGSALVRPNPPLPNDDHSKWENLYARTDCPSDANDEEQLACIREKSADELQRIADINSLMFGEYMLDDSTYLAKPALAWASGSIARVPLLIGSTADDGSILTVFSNTTIEEYVTAKIGDSNASQQILALYSDGGRAVTGLTSEGERLSQLATDFIFRCSSNFVANVSSSHLQVPTWQYDWNAIVPSNTFTGLEAIGAWHGSEVPIVFGTYPIETSNEAEINLSRSMQKQFADFVKDPEAGPGWEQWPQAATLTLKQDDAETIVEDVSQVQGQCQAWDVVWWAQIAEQLGVDIEDVETALEDPEQTNSQSHATGRLATAGGLTFAAAAGLLSLCLVL